MADPYRLNFAEDTAGTFGGTSPTAGSTFIKTPGNVQEIRPNSQTDADIINFKPFQPQISNAPRVFNPADVIGPPPAQAADTTFMTPSEKEAERLKPHQDALTGAKRYYDLAAHVTGLHNESKKFADSADFLTKLGTLERTDPNFEQKFAEISAAHPYADGDLVQATVHSKMNARGKFMEAMQHGGAAEFGSEQNQTPEYHAYKVALHESKDPTIARAAAMQTKQGEEMIADAASKGIFNADTDLPAWDPAWADPKNKNRPKIWNPDASINYAEARKVITAKAGSGESLKLRLEGEKNSVAAAEKFLQIHKVEPEPEDPLFKDWHAANSIINRAMRNNLGPTQRATAPSPTPTAAPAAAVTPPTSAQAYTKF